MHISHKTLWTLKIISRHETIKASHDNVYVIAIYGINIVQLCRGQNYEYCYFYDGSQYHKETKTNETIIQLAMAFYVLIYDDN